jgi:hypothetical protein
MGRNISEGIRQIQGLKLIRDSRGTKVLPGSWKPGDPPLSAASDLIGRWATPGDCRRVPRDSLDFTARSATLQVALGEPEPGSQCEE